jgi:hypothetical protein
MIGMLVWIGRGLRLLWYVNLFSYLFGKERIYEVK